MVSHESQRCSTTTGIHRRRNCNGDRKAHLQRSQPKTKRKVSFGTTKQSARVSAVTVAKPKRRPDRRSQLTMQTGNLQHAWVTIMLRRRGLPVRDNAMLDHGRLLHNVIYGTSSAPSGAMMDGNYDNIRRSMGGPDTGNMVPQMQTFVCRQERDSMQHQLNTEQQWEYDAQQQLPTAPTWDDAAESELCMERTLNSGMRKWTAT